MPRPVVPIRRVPRNRSATRSRARWCGMIRCASAEISSREVSTPRSSRPSISPSSTSGSITTPLPMTGVQPGVRMPDGIRCSAYFSPSGRDHRVPGVVAALVADDVVHPAAEQVGGLALALVAPLGADQHDSRHRVLVLLASSAPGGSRLVRWQGIRMAVRRLDLRRLEPGRPPAGGRRRRPPTPRRSPSGARCRRSRRCSRRCSRPTGPRGARSPGSRPADRDSVGLARDIGVGTGEQRELGLVRDDHGGVLLHHGRIEAAGDGRRALSRRLGLQAHHDDIKVADGEITRIDVRPDWRAVDTIGVTVMLQPLRPDAAHQRPRRAGGLRPGADPPGRRRLSAAGQPLDLVRRPPGAVAAAALNRTPCAAARTPRRVPAGRGRGHWPHPARRGGPAADVLRPDRAMAAPGACR